MIKSDTLGVIGRLNHCGIMTNYQCNAACRHCLYACSPDRSGGYISKETAQDICTSLVKGGCKSVHIGGGEPFLNFNGLINLLEATRKTGIQVDYIETNGFWAADENLATSYLHELSKAGVDALCISLDPFHAEYIPYSLPLRLAEICKNNHFGYFLWQEHFSKILASVPQHKIHNRKKLEKLISPNYVLETARNYGVKMGGRAINIEKEYMEPKDLADLLNSTPCRNLLSTDHFHVDLYGKFIPPGCTGIAIPLEEALNGIPERKYPAFESLLFGGVAKLYEYAKKRGFAKSEKKIKNEYTSSCALCFHIRKWLSERAGCPELNAEHYKASLSCY
ncbi:MAG: 4Fe-4S cluster-binding domain-containing protein [Defluviitaleaceae bacterium]|nr:4Fe-4S cluster-binding domain-containing protein [Defluviitaleaceae bacterium]